MFSSLLCFIPLNILFTIILMASQEQEKINMCSQSYFFGESFIKDSLKLVSKESFLFNWKLTEVTCSFLLMVTDKWSVMYYHKMIVLSLRLNLTSTCPNAHGYHFTLAASSVKCQYHNYTWFLFNRSILRLNKKLFMRHFQDLDGSN